MAIEKNNSWYRVLVSSHILESCFQLHVNTRVHLPLSIIVNRNPRIDDIVVLFSIQDPRNPDPRRVLLKVEQVVLDFSRPHHHHFWVGRITSIRQQEDDALKMFLDAEEGDST